MAKRILATVLWFVAGWYGGAFIAFFADTSAVLGPILGATAAALVAFDPRRVFWGRVKA